MLELEAHPHARAVLSAALDGQLAHAYLLHGPAGTGKRAAARGFAAELLARDSADPASARTRVEHGTHPDLTWIAPSGAHEMLRRDVEEAVVAAAAHTPFEATHRVFVLERADTMNDEAANSLLKTLEEPPAYVVLLLLTDRPTQVLPTVASRCQAVRFDPVAPEQLAAQLQDEGIAPETADACARLSLGDGERARILARDEGLRAAAEAFARAALDGTTGAQRPWTAVLKRAYEAGARARRDVEAALAEEKEFLPKKEHKRRETEFNERARRAERRAETATLDHALQLVGLWFRDLACLAAGAPELVFNSDRDLRPGPPPHALRKAQELVDDTRARLPLNVTYELALEALAYRLEAELSSSSASA